ncbi:MAG: sulfatase [Candidatus Eiseniibacteriota bacterium]
MTNQRRTGSPPSARDTTATLLFAGLLLGLAAGVHDAAATLLENPRSFDGAVDAVRFAGAAMSLLLLLGGAGGLVAGTLRVPLRVFVVAGVAAWLFAWAGVRLHVRFFFGEPLLAPANLAANVALLALALAIGAVSGGRAERVVRRLCARRSVAVIAAAFALAAAAVLLPARARELPVPVGSPPAGARDVLLLTLDTTRADHLSCYGYPRGTTPWIDRLARKGRISMAMSHIPLTAPSHASMFTDDIPRGHGLLNNGMALADTTTTLAERLAGLGWNCAAFISGIPLKAQLSGLDRGFSVYDDTFSALERVHPMLTALAAVRVANRVLPIDLIERRSSDTCEAARRWLGRSQGPRFLWVHCFDPHTPYDAPRVLRERFARESAGWTANGSPVTEWPIADYDAEIRETDRHAGRLAIEFLDRSDHAFVLVTADHGEGLGQHGELTHGALLYEEDLQVPFIEVGGYWTKPGVGPTARPHRDLVDVGRTVMSGALQQWLMSCAASVAETFAPEGRHDRTAVLFAETKLIANRETGEEEAYDLAADPGEKYPLDPADPRCALLREMLPPPRDSRHAGPDPETVRRLRALGYIHDE